MYSTLRGENSYGLEAFKRCFSNNGNTVLIDISGIGGVMYEWLAPEMRDEISPFDLPFQTSPPANKLTISDAIFRHNPIPHNPRQNHRSS